MENKTYKLLLIDDEQEAYAVVKNGLSRHGFEVFYESNPENALNSISTHKPDTILLDIMFSGNPRGKELLEEIKKSKHKTVPVVMLTNTMKDYKETDYPDAAFPFAKNAFKQGEAAFDSLSEQIRNVLNINNSEITALDDKKFGFVVGKTRQMHDVCKIILHVAPVDTTLLITGETGTGKEKVAKAIHNLSSRNEKPFVTVNCGAFTEDNLLISELFGHERGAFTGATETRKGIFETASGGTIFLDEIGDAMPNAQVKLLRVIQEQEITRLGSSAPIKINIRIIAATNRSLEEEVKARQFREDLYHRLAVVPIHLPPLRERSDDIEILFSHFVNIFNKIHKKHILDILNNDLLKAFREYNWPGNIREFENKIESAIIRKKDGNVLLPGDFNLIQKETLPIDVNSISNKFLEGPLGIEYYTGQLNGDSRRAVILDVYNKYCQRNGRPPTNEDLAGIFKTTSGNMRQKLSEEHIELKKLKKQNN